MTTECEIIIEAVDIIRQYPKDDRVLREQLALIKKNAKTIQDKIKE